VSAGVGPAPRRILVTGGAGFIGRWLVAHLLDLGHRVVVVDDGSNAAPDGLASLLGHPGLDAVLEADLRAPASIAQLFAVDYDIIYHLASSPRVQATIDAPIVAFERDLHSTFLVLEGARRQRYRTIGLRDGAPFPAGEAERRAGPRVVYTSTALVYSADTGGMLAETHATGPASPFAAAKLGAETLVQAYGRTYGLDVRIARPFNFFGPHQRPSGGVVARFVWEALAGRSLTVKGDGRQRRDFLYVEDGLAALATLGLSDAGELDGAVVNLGAGVSVGIGELALRIADGMVPVTFVPHDHPQAEPGELCADVGRARRLLGLEATVGLDEGIARTMAAFAARGVGG
jgi:nucleoside-diphosphate-sugar epimerase